MEYLSDVIPSSLMHFGEEASMDADAVVKPPLRIRYKIEFPPGPMGLELDPVIRSSEREIGCRVKDYYFGMDHKGVDRKYIETRIAIGDIVCSINGEDVKSLPFVNIVDKLKSLRDSKRVISFKNISASCKCLLYTILLLKWITLFYFRGRRKSRWKFERQNNTNNSHCTIRYHWWLSFIFSQICQK